MEDVATYDRHIKLVCDIAKESNHAENEASEGHLAFKLRSFCVLFVGQIKEGNN